VPRGPRHPTSYYVDLGETAIRQMLREHHAVVWPEIEARAADRVWGDLPYAVDPHHLTTARSNLLADDVITRVEDPTRGGRRVAVYHLSDLRGRATAVRDTSARKRLLHGRFIGWASGTATSAGLIGPAGEAVARAALRAAAPRGYLVLQPESADIAEVLGAAVPGGPLDAAAFLTLLSDQGEPLPAYFVPIEVKNLREWLYPRTPEVHQLLYKAAALQVAHPDQPMVPVLVCRRAHQTTFYMAFQLGFHVIDTYSQFISPTVEAEPLEEVKSELGYLDLTPDLTPPDRVISQFSTVVPTVASTRAAAWQTTAPEALDLVDALREDSLAGLDRDEAMRELRELNQALGRQGGW
jgi:hypothetical protein